MTQVMTLAMAKVARRAHQHGTFLGLCFVLSPLLTGCYFVNFFTKKPTSQDTAGTVATDTVLGRSLGTQAGGPNEVALDAIYALTSSLPPAPIRPDPDMYARRLLLQYRNEGTTVARQIGAIEGYRLLLGGASADFMKTPQENFDATSLLANLTVAEMVCTGLVAPNARNHEGWDTILPYAASNTEANIRFLAQRFTGKHSNALEAEKISDLVAIFNANNTDANATYSDYVPVCTALALDADALLL